jgi:hypothetical protein
VLVIMFVLVIMALIVADHLRTVLSVTCNTPSAVHLGDPLFQVLSL